MVDDDDEQPRPRRDRFYDHFDRQWVPKPAEKNHPGKGLRHELHQDLIEQLINSEIEFGLNPIARLYALLLARTLCQADPALMEEFGEHIVMIDRQRSKTAHDE
jgi:hypothetical protein